MKIQKIMIPLLIASMLLSGCGNNSGSGSQSDNGKMRKI